MKVLYEAENRGFKIPSAGRSVRTPNVHIMLVCYRAFRKPRAGALGSLTECPLDIRSYGVRELTPKTSKPQTLPTPPLPSTSYLAAWKLPYCTPYIAVAPPSK